jgi:O-antigen ligase
MKQEYSLCQTGLLILIGLLPLLFNPYAALPFEQPKTLLFHLATFTLVVAVLFLQLPQPLKKSNWIYLFAYLKRPIILSGLAYFLFCGLSALRSKYRLLDFSVADLWTGSLLTHFSLASFFLLTVYLVRSERDIERVLDVLLATSLPIMAYGFAQFLGLDPISWVTNSVSPMVSTLGRSNFLAAYLVIIMPYALSKYYHLRSRNRFNRFLLLILIQTICVYLTLARAAYLAVAAGLFVTLIILAYRFRNRGLAMAGLAVLLSGSIAFMPDTHMFVRAQAAPTTLPQEVAFIEVRQESVDTRITIWLYTLELVPQQWLIGYGPTSYDVVMRNYYPDGLPGKYVTFSPDDPHNLFLRILLETGLIGLITFLGVVVASFHAVIKGIFEKTTIFNIATLAGSAGALTAYIVQAQLNPNVLVVDALFWLVVSVIVVLQRWIRIRAEGTVLSISQT